ncbi:acyl-CoA thioesterase [Novosphingobium bradum]|uniref:Acyl-CoA thioesterase n=1 Tax=Novosphingobium bradum TaxID=1737444 RepID=A0ABV7IQZ0_9SPHN
MNARPPISSGDAALAAADLLALEPLGHDRFRAWRNQDNRTGTLFGGQPLAQALAAAGATVPDWPAHTLTGHFLRAGQLDRPIDYAVERTRDGRRYASRRVIASQDGRAIFDALCAFHDPEDGAAEHQAGAISDGVGPAAPGPEGLLDMREVAARNPDRLPPMMRRAFALPFPVELRIPDPTARHEPGGAIARDFWFRVPSASALAAPRDHHAMIAFASDYWLAATAVIPHEGYGVNSLNHSLWLHGPARADDWLLYRASSDWAGQGRGLAQGRILDRAGRLVASTVQEISLRRYADRA